MAARRVRGADLPALRTVHARDVRRMSGDVTESVRGASWGWWNPDGERISVLAIDIGKHAGWCVIDEVGISYHGEFKTRGGTEPDDAWIKGVSNAITVLDDVASIDSDGVSSSLFVVEDVFLKNDVSALAALARKQGVATGVAYEIMQLPVIRVAPISWQSKMLGPKHLRAAGKRESIARARAEFGEIIANEHMADAALMAKWVWGGGR